MKESTNLPPTSLPQDLPSPRKTGLNLLVFGVILLAITIGAVAMAIRFDLRVDFVTRLATLPGLVVVFLFLRGCIMTLTGKEWNDLRSGIRILFLVLVAPVVIISVILIIGGSLEAMRS